MTPKNSAPSIALASDHAGIELKALLKSEIEKDGRHVEDLGPISNESVDYPDYANKLAAWMDKHPGSIGILICGSGIGMSSACALELSSYEWLSEDGKRARFLALLAALEAMAAGVPVVASDAGPLPEVVSDGESGLVVAAGDDQAWAQAILALASDRSLRLRLGNGARERACREFSVEDMADRTVAVYEEL